MTITFNSSRSVQEYEDIRYKLILQLEESGNEEPVPYLDSKGIATVGAGFNLRIRGNVEAILEKVFRYACPFLRFIPFCGSAVLRFCGSAVLRFCVLSLSESQVDGVFELYSMPRC